MNNSTVLSGARLDSISAHRPSIRVASCANPHASAPATITNSRLSVSSWRSNSLRRAPSASRKENSRCRVALRAISSITTLVSAISSTRPTMAINMRSGLPYIPS